MELLELGMSFGESEAGHPMHWASAFPHSWQPPSQLFGPHALLGVFDLDTGKANSGGSARVGNSLAHEDSQER